MLLHSGTRFHTHEYSPTHPESSTQRRRPPLGRSAFSHPVKTPNSYDSPTRPSILQSARPVSVGPSPVRRAPERVSFKAPDLDTMSEDGISCGVSETSETTIGETQKKRKTPRTTTSYLLAHPPPTTRQKKILHIRPKLLFQLQRTTGEKRPVPVVDALVSTTIAPRLAKKFPRVFKGKGELGVNDVMILRSEDYDAPETNIIEDSDDETLSDREVLAVICQVRGSSDTEICLGDGSLWRASALPKGTFQFSTEDPLTGEEVTARWVQRTASRRHSDILNSSLLANNVSVETKYTFSVLNPGLRRHPIMASLTQTFLDIPDHYTTVSSSISQPPLSSPTIPSGMAAANEDSLHCSTIIIDDELRLLIQVTGIWVALRQGWCSHFKYPDNVNGITTCPTTVSGSGRARAHSLNADVGHKGGKADTRASTPESTQSSLHALRQAFKSPNCSPSQTERMGMPKRTVSAGTAFMQKQRAARLAGNTPSTVNSDSEAEPLPSPLPHSASFENGVTRSMPSSPMARDVTSFSPLMSPTTPSQSRFQPAFRHSTSGLQYGKSGHLRPGSADDYKQSQDSSAEPYHQPDKERKRPKGGRWKNFVAFFKRGEQRKDS